MRSVSLVPVCAFGAVKVGIHPDSLLLGDASIPHDELSETDDTKSPDAAPPAETTYWIVISAPDAFGSYPIYISHSPDAEQCSAGRAPASRTN